jgi:hypothetical protein
MVNITKTVGDQGNNSSEDVALVQPYFIVNLFLVLFSFVILVSGCNRNETPTPANSDNVAKAPDGTKYLALEHFETKKGAFELGMAPCTAEGCAFEVRWLEASKPVSSIAMPNLATTQDVQKGTANLNMGVGPDLPAWSFSEDGYFLTTIARTIMLDAETVGLLLTQYYGWDHVKRLHRLVVPHNGNLVMVWDFDESAGPTWSASVVVAKSVGQMALFWGFDNGHVPSDADRLSVTLLKWDNTKWKFIPELGKKVATLLTLGNFNTPGDARKFRQSDTKGCVSPYWVLSSDTIKILPQGHGVLGKVFVLNDHARVELEKKRLIDCGIKLKLSVVDVVSSPMPYEMRE